MKLKILKTIILILFYNVSFSQPKDTIYGKVKSIREQLIFLNKNLQNLKLFSTEGDYGHNGFSSEEYTKNRFNIWWYSTHWVHYINYYKEFDINNKLLKVVWYYKDQSILNSTENKYDPSGNLVSQKLKSYNESMVTHQYDKNNNLIFTKSIDSANNNYTTTKYEYNDKNKIVKEEYYNSKYPKEIKKTEYYYNDVGNVIELKRFGRYGESYGTKYEYDTKNRRTKIISHSPFLWVKTETGSMQERTKNGNDQISKEFIYDEKARIIEIRSYRPDFDDENKAQLYLKEVRIYDNDLIKYAYSYNDKDSITNYKKYEYDTKNRKIKDANISPKYPKNNITLQYFYGETEYPIKLIYTEENTPVEVDFEYVFDDRKNWIEQTKSINGKKLYVWKRELKYW